MTRLLLAGHQTKSLPSGAITGFAEGQAVAGAVLDTTEYRTGGAAAKCPSDGTTSPYVIYAAGGGADNRDYYARAWLWFDALPTAAVEVLRQHSLNGTFACVRVRLTPGGKLQLLNAAGTQIGADSDETLVAGAKFCVQTRCRRSTTANTSVFELLLNGALVATSSTEPAPSGAPYELRCGVIGAPGSAMTVWVDDLAVNDGVATGGAEVGYPPLEGRVLLAPPTRLIAAGSWVTCKGTSTSADIVDALDNFPPLGEADAINHTHAAQQVRCAAAASTAAPDWLEVECQSLGRIGVPGHCFVDTATATARNLGDVAGNTRVAQGFYLAGTVDYAEVFLRKQGGPSDNVVLELRSDSSGAPSGTVLATVSVPGSGLTGSFAAVRFDGLLQPLTPEAKYWLVLSRSGANDATNYYQIENGGGNGYYDGGVTNWNGSAWGAVDQSAACRFRAYHSIGNATINNLLVIACHGEGSGTGTKTGALGVTLPAGVPQGTITNFGSDAGACAAYPTNWTFQQSRGGAATVPVASMALQPRVRVGKTDSGTRSAVVCALACQLEYSDPVVGWKAYTKTADSTTWWAKRAPTSLTSYYDASGTETPVSCQAGDWLITPDPLPAEGVMLTSLATETDANIKANYTPV